MVSSPQLIVRQNERRNFKSLEDLQGKRLGVGTGSNYEQIASRLGGIQVRTYKALLIPSKPSASGASMRRSTTACGRVPGEAERTAALPRWATRSSGSSKTPRWYR